MHTSRSFRLLVIALPVCAAATVAVLFGAQGAGTPGDPLVAGFKSTYPASETEAGYVLLKPVTNGSPGVSALCAATSTATVATAQNGRAITSGRSERRVCIG